MRAGGWKDPLVSTGREELDRALLQKCPLWGVEIPESCTDMLGCWMIRTRSAYIRTEGRPHAECGGRHVQGLGTRRPLHFNDEDAIGDSGGVDANRGFSRG